MTLMKSKSEESTGSIHFRIRFNSYAYDPKKTRLLNLQAEPEKFKQSQC